MFFSLEVLRARKGDCLLLHYGSAADPRLVMIDGGPSSVYGPHLKPRILALRKARGLAADDPLVVDLLMVSHVDDDHIKGILDMTRELIAAQDNKKPLMLKARSVWHNTFEDIIGGSPAELTAAFSGAFGAASLGAEVSPDMMLEAGEEREVVVWNLKALASIKQGAQLRNDIAKLKFSLNPQFGGKLILADDAPAQPVEIGKGLTFTVAGPMLPELKKLHEKHQEWLEDLKKEGQKPSDVLSAYVDRSVPNLSSVVVLAEAGGKKMLLTGDARGDKILEGLEQVGLIKKKTTGKLRVNVLKVPHHGSSNNLNPDFFERITADHYVFSGNGEHGNPERESLEMLLEARGVTARYTVHLTYPVDEMDVEREKAWDKEQAKKKKALREAWSPAEHSLAALFKANPAFAKKVKIVDKDKPHLIDLRDKVKF